MGHRIAPGSSPVYHGGGGQAKRRPHRPMTAMPLVVFSGPTAAGKTTLARDLETNKRLVRAPAVTQAPKAEPVSEPEHKRLLSWLQAGGESRLDNADVAAHRLAGLAALAVCDEAETGTVVDAAGPAALLLPPRNAALLVMVDAAVAVRAERVRRLLDGGITLRDALQIVRQKDAATVAAIRAAWGLDITDQAATRWRFDLVIRCPDEESCRSPQRCLEASRATVRAALSVYRRFLRNEAGADEVLRLSTVTERHRPWLVRIAPMLLDPAVPHTLAVWQDRLSHELASMQSQPEAGT
jgi:hypothetical protein